MIHLTTKQEFEKEFLQSEGKILLDFYADWCGPCTALSANLEIFENENIGKVKILKVNIDEFPELAGAFNVMSIPTVIFKNGTDVKKFVGVKSVHELSEFCGLI